jgi:hypothetical protein
MSGNVFRHHKETPGNNDFHKVMDGSHMSSGEIKDDIKE